MDKNNEKVIVLDTETYEDKKPTSKYQKLYETQLPFQIAYYIPGTNEKKEYIVSEFKNNIKDNYFVRTGKYSANDFKGEEKSFKEIMGELTELSKKGYKIWAYNSEFDEEVLKRASKELNANIKLPKFNDIMASFSNHIKANPSDYLKWATKNGRTYTYNNSTLPHKTAQDAHNYLSGKDLSNGTAEKHTALEDCIYEWEILKKVSQISDTNVDSKKLEKEVKKTTKTIKIAEKKLDGLDKNSKNNSGKKSSLVNKNSNSKRELTNLQKALDEQKKEKEKLQEKLVKNKERLLKKYDGKLSGPKNNNSSLSSEIKKSVPTTEYSYDDFGNRLSKYGFNKEITNNFPLDIKHSILETLEERKKNGFARSKLNILDYNEKYLEENSLKLTKKQWEKVREVSISLRNERAEALKVTKEEYADRLKNEKLSNNFIIQTLQTIVNAGKQDEKMVQLSDKQFDDFNKMIIDLRAANGGQIAKLYKQYVDTPIGYNLPALVGEENIKPNSLNNYLKQDVLGTLDSLNKQNLGKQHQTAQQSAQHLLSRNDKDTWNNVTNSMLKPGAKEKLSPKHGEFTRVPFEYIKSNRENYMYHSMNDLGISFSAKEIANAYINNYTGGMKRGSKEIMKATALDLLSSATGGNIDDFFIDDSDLEKIFEMREGKKTKSVTTSDIDKMIMGGYNGNPSKKQYGINLYSLLRYVEKSDIDPNYLNSELFTYNNVSEEYIDEKVIKDYYDAIEKKKQEVIFKEKQDKLKSIYQNNQLQYYLKTKAKQNGTYTTGGIQNMPKKPVIKTIPKDYSKKIYYEDANEDGLNREDAIFEYLSQFDYGNGDTDMVRAITKAVSGRKGGKGSRNEAEPLIEMAKNNPYNIGYMIDAIINNFANLKKGEKHKTPYDYQVEWDNKTGTFTLDFFPKGARDKIDPRSMVKIPLPMLNDKGHLTVYGQENTNIPILDFWGLDPNDVQQPFFENSVENLLSFAINDTNFSPNNIYDKRRMIGSNFYHFLTDAFDDYHSDDETRIENGRKNLLRARDSLDTNLKNHKIGSEVLSNFQALSEDFRNAQQGVGSVESSSIGEGYAYLAYGLNKLITPELREAYKEWYPNAHKYTKKVKKEDGKWVKTEVSVPFKGDYEQINKNIVDDIITNVLAPYMTGALNEEQANILAQHLIETRMGYLSNKYYNFFGEEEWEKGGKDNNLFEQASKGLAGTLHNLVSNYFLRSGITVDTGQESQFKNGLLSISRNADLSVSANAVDLTNNKIKKVLATSPKTESAIWAMLEHSGLTNEDVTDEYKWKLAEDQFYKAFKDRGKTYNGVRKADIEYLDWFLESLGYNPYVNGPEDIEKLEKFNSQDIFSNVPEQYINKEARIRLRNKEIGEIYQSNIDANGGKGNYNDVPIWGFTLAGKNNHLIPNLSKRKVFTPFQVANGHANDNNFAGNVLYREQRININEENIIKERMINRLMNEMLGDGDTNNITEEQKEKAYQQAVRKVGNFGAQEGGMIVNSRVRGATAGQLNRTSQNIAIKDISDTFKETRDKIKDKAIREWEKKYGSEDWWEDDVFLSHKNSNSEDKFDEGLQLLYGQTHGLLKLLDEGKRDKYEEFVYKKYRNDLIKRTFQDVVANKKKIDKNSVTIGTPGKRFDVNDILGESNNYILDEAKLLDEYGRIDELKLSNFLNGDHTSDAREMSLQFFEDKPADNAQKLLGMDVKGSVYYASEMFFEEFAKLRAEELANSDASQGKFEKNSKKYKEALKKYENELRNTDILAYQEGVNGRNFGPSFITYMDEVYDRTNRKTNANGETDLDRLLNIMGITPDSEERKKGRYVFSSFFERDESNLRGNIEKLNDFLNKNGYDDIADVYKYNDGSDPKKKPEDFPLLLNNLKWAGRTFLSQAALPAYGNPGGANIRSDYRLQDTYVRQPDMNGALSEDEKKALVSFDLGEVEFVKGTDQFGSSYRVKENGNYGRMNGVNNRRHIEDLQKYWKEFNEISRTQELTFGDYKAFDPIGLEFDEDGNPVIRNAIAYMGSIDKFMHSKVAQDTLSKYDENTKKKIVDAIGSNFINLEGTLDYESANKHDYGDYKGRKYVKKYGTNSYFYEWMDKPGEKIKDIGILNQIDPLAHMIEVSKGLGGELNYVPNSGWINKNDKVWNGDKYVDKTISNNHITLPIKAFSDSIEEGEFKTSPFTRYLSEIISNDRTFDAYLKHYKDNEEIGSEYEDENHEAELKSKTERMTELARLYSERGFDNYANFLNAYINKDESEMDKVKSTGIYNSEYINPITPTLANYLTGYEGFTWKQVDKNGKEIGEHKLNTNDNASAMDRAIRNKFDNSIVLSSKSLNLDKTTNTYGNAEKLLMNQGNMNDNDYITSLENQYEYMYGNLYGKDEIKKQLSKIASIDKDKYADNLRERLIKSSTFGEEEFTKRLELAAKKGVDFRGLLADSIRYPLSSGYDAKKFDLFFNRDYSIGSGLVGLGLAGDYNMDWDGDKIGIYLDLFRNDWKDVKNIDDLLPAKIKQKEAQDRTSNAIGYEMRKKYTKGHDQDIQYMDANKYDSIFNARSQATGAILSKLLKSKTGLASNRYQAILQSLTYAKRMNINKNNPFQNEATTFGTAAVFEALTQDAISAKKVIERVNAHRDEVGQDHIKEGDVFSQEDLEVIDKYLYGYDELLNLLEDRDNFKDAKTLNEKVFKKAQEMGIFGADGEEFFSERITPKIKSAFQNLYTDEKGFVNDEQLANAYGIDVRDIDKYKYHYKPIKDKKDNTIGYTNELDKEEQNKHLITVKDKDKDGKEITKQIMAPITGEMAANFVINSNKLLKGAGYGDIAQVQTFGKNVVAGIQNVGSKPFDFMGTEATIKGLSEKEIDEGMQQIQGLHSPSSKNMKEELEILKAKQKGVDTLETSTSANNIGGTNVGVLSPEAEALANAETANIEQRIDLLGNEKGIIKDLTLTVSNLSKVAEYFGKQCGIIKTSEDENKDAEETSGDKTTISEDKNSSSSNNPFDNNNPNKPDNSYLNGARTSVLLDDRFGGFKNKYAKDTFEDQVKAMYDNILLGDYNKIEKSYYMDDFLRNSYGSSDNKINRLNFRADLTKLHTIINGKLYDSTHQFISDVSHWTNGEYEIDWDKFSDYEKFKNNIFDNNHKDAYFDEKDENGEGTSGVLDYYYDKKTGKIKSRNLTLREAMQRQLTSSGLTGVNTHGGGEGIEFLRGNMSEDEIEKFIKADIRSQIYQRRFEAEEDLLKKGNDKGALDLSEKNINFLFNHQKMQTVDVNPNRITYEELEKRIDDITKLRMQDYGYNKAFSIVSKKPLLKFASQAGGELPTEIAAITGGITANKVLRQFHDYQYLRNKTNPSELTSKKFTDDSLGTENNFVIPFDGFNANGRSDVLMRAPGENGEDAIWLLDKKYPGHDSLRYAAQMYTYSKGLKNLFTGSGMSKIERDNFLRANDYEGFIKKFEKSEVFKQFRDMYETEGDKIHGSDVISKELYKALRENPDLPIYNGIVGNENGMGYIDRLVMDERTKELMDKKLNRTSTWLEDRELDKRVKNSWHRDFVSQINNPEAYDTANQYIDDLDAEIKEYNDKRILVKKYRSDIKALKKQAKDENGTIDTTEEEKALAGVTQEGELARSKVRGTFGKVFQMKDGAFVLDEFGKRILTDFGKTISQQQVEIMNNKADKFMSAQSGMYGGAADVIIESMQGAPKKQGVFSSLGNMGRGLISMVPFYHLIRVFSKVTQEMKQLDSTMTNLRIVTGDNREEAGNLITQYSNLAGTLGRTTTEVTNAAIEWQRQGYSSAETLDLIKSSMYLSTLGMIDANTATKDLTKMLLML